MFLYFSQRLLLNGTELNAGNERQQNHGYTKIYVLPQILIWQVSNPHKTLNTHNSAHPKQTKNKQKHSTKNANINLHKLTLPSSNFW